VSCHCLPFFIERFISIFFYSSLQRRQQTSIRICGKEKFLSKLDWISDISCDFSAVVAAVSVTYPEFESSFGAYIHHPA
jgi:hypothetical protein